MPEVDLSTLPLSAQLRVRMALAEKRPMRVARAIGCSRSHMSHVLHGDAKPSAKLLAKIEAAIRDE